MRKELENGYTVEIITNIGTPLVRVYNEVGVQVMVKRDLPSEETTLLVGDAMAEAHRAGRIDERSYLANLINQIIKKNLS